MIPKDAELLKGRRELAFGEVTGHAHRIDVGDLFQTKDGELYLNAPRLATLTHEEHKTAKVPAGASCVKIAQQYNPATGWQNTKD